MPNSIVSKEDMKMIGKEIVTTDLAPAPLEPYSEAVKVGNHIFVSGQRG